MAPASVLELLRSTLAATPARSSDVFGRPSRAVSCAWETVDGTLSAHGTARGAAPGLVRGGVHEWFGVDGPRSSRPAAAGRPEDWSPPLFLLAHVARRAVLDATERGAPRAVVWVGRSVWPYPRALADGVEVVETGPVLRGESSGGELEIGLTLRETPEAFTAEGGALFHCSLFVDPPDANLRLWAVDTALRCPGVTAVVADGSGLGMAATRRLQLAAAAADALVLTARPPNEVRQVSAATTRWIVTRSAGEGACAGDSAGNSHGDGANEPRWSMTLLRAKGAQSLDRSTLDHRT